MEWKLLFNGAVGSSLNQNLSYAEFRTSLAGFVIPNYSGDDWRVCYNDLA